MNVMDRSLSSAVDQDAAAAKLAARKRRRAIALVLLAVLIAAAVYYVWAMTLCGDCGAPMPLPPPPA